MPTQKGIHYNITITFLKAQPDNNYHYLIFFEEYSVIIVGTFSMDSILYQEEARSMTAVNISMWIDLLDNPVALTMRYMIVSSLVTYLHSYIWPISNNANMTAGNSRACYKGGTIPFLP